MKKSIFFIIPNLSSGGAERVMSVVANGLYEMGYDVHFIILKNSVISYPLNSGITMHIRENIKHKDGFAQMKYVRDFMKNNPKAIFVSFITNISVYCFVSSFGMKTSMIVSERNDPSKNVFYEKIIISILYRWRVCSRVVFQTDGAKNYFSKKIRNKGVVIANPIKDNLPTRTSSHEKTIVSVARLEPQKNYPLLLDAFADFSLLHDDYKLIIYGDGSLKDELINQAKQLNISDKVELAGFCSDVHEKTKNAGMYVLSSDYEGISNSMLEALAMGIPTVCTDSPPGGARQFIKSYENGILTTVGNREELTKAMCYIAENPEKADEMGKKASEVKQMLSSSEICRIWDDMLTKVYSEMR